MTEFCHCPQCNSTAIEQTDYEDYPGHTDDDGRCCKKCGWEGDVSELVSEEEDN